MNFFNTLMICIFIYNTVKSWKNLYILNKVELLYNGIVVSISSGVFLPFVFYDYDSLW